MHCKSDRVGIRMICISKSNSIAVLRPYRSLNCLMTVEFKIQDASMAFNMRLYKTSTGSSIPMAHLICYKANYNTALKGKLPCQCPDSSQCPDKARPDLSALVLALVCLCC